ncbi:hypothetical protein D3C78_1539590 [compost metagenome]
MICSAITGLTGAAFASGESGMACCSSRFAALLAVRAGLAMNSGLPSRLSMRSIRYGLIL